MVCIQTNGESVGDAGMKRLIDIAVSLFVSIVILPVVVVIAAAVKLTSPGPVLYWSDRVGRENRIFRMAKFRTMRTETPQLATHLLTDSQSWITPLGRFLRKTSLDEIPQLWNILRGDMSLVGPRPALFNQDDLVALRTEHGVHRLVPGITGWAQINGRDELTIPEKVAQDREYRDRQTAWFDLYILFMTVVRVLQRDGVRQADEPSSRNGSVVSPESAGSERRAA